MEKALRKNIVDDIRDALIKSENPKDETVLALVSKIRRKEFNELGTLFPLVSAIKRAINSQVDPEWLFNVGVPKSIKIRLPKAIIISDKINTDEKLMKSLNNCIYILGNRAIFFFPESLYLCDVRECNPTELSEKHNPIAIKKMEEFLRTTKYKGTPKDILDDLIKRSRGINFDCDEDDLRMFDCDEDESFFSGNFKEFQKELISRLAWLEWLETATEAEIKKELQMNYEAFRWMLEDEDESAGEEIESKKQEQKRRILHLININ